MGPVTSQYEDGLPDSDDSDDRGIRARQIRNFYWGMGWGLLVTSYHRLCDIIPEFKVSI